MILCLCVSLARRLGKASLVVMANSTLSDDMANSALSDEGVRSASVVSLVREHAGMHWDFVFLDRERVNEGGDEWL